MRLYTCTGATALTDPTTGKVYEANEQGGFDFPDELSDQLYRFHLGGRPAWENDIERQRRLMAEEVERRKDPAALLGVMEQLVQAAQAAPAPTPAVPDGSLVPVAKAPRTRKSAAAKPDPAE